MINPIVKPTNAHLAAEYIKKILPSFKATVGVVLGSGLGKYAEELDIL